MRLRLKSAAVSESSPTASVGRLVDVRSQLVRAVLTYLRAEAASAGELPPYFPERLRSGPPFGRLRQRVRVSDRKALERWQERQVGSDPHAPHRAQSEAELDWDDEVADHFTRAIVLGEPGSGKSWLLRYDAWRIAIDGVKHLAERSAALDRIRLPVRVHLAELLQFLQRRLERSHCSRGDAVRDALADIVLERTVMGLTGHDVPPGFRDWVVRTIESDRCVVLLDALDEVPLEQSALTASHPTGRTGLSEYLTHWARQFPDVSVRVTVRDAGYRRAHPPIHEAPELVVLALDQRGIERFSQAWFDGSEAINASLLAMLDAHDQMRGLASNPLMLSLMCRVLEDRRQDFPLRRVEFYDRCVRGLVREWKEEDKRQFIAVEHVEASIDVLSHVAASLLLQNPPFEESEVGRLARQAIGRLSAGVLPNVGLVERFKEDGLLVPVSARPGAPLLFLHRTFQEYLAGIALVTPGVEASGAGPASVVSAAAMIASALEPHITDAAWREAILLGLGYVAVTQTRVTMNRHALVSTTIAEVLDRRAGSPGVAAELMGTVVAQLPGAVTTQCVSRVQRELVVAMRADGPTDLTQSDVTCRPRAPAKIRAACGDALARIGDLRFHGPERWCLPNDVECGFANSEEDDCFGFVEIPVGEPLVGSDKSADADARDNELPQRHVAVDTFWIGRWPVTVTQFHAYSQATDGNYNHSIGGNWMQGLSNHPVVHVNASACETYCRWLGQEFRLELGRLPRTLRALIESGWGVDLPTEHEWECAARGDTGWIYPWGNEWDAEKANCGEVGIGKTTAVGCFPVGAAVTGVEDLIGNVSEITKSGHLRGGGFGETRRILRVAYRTRSDNVSYDRGFRIVLRRSGHRYL